MSMLELLVWPTGWNINIKQCTRKRGRVKWALKNRLIKTGLTWWLVHFCVRTFSSLVVFDITKKQSTFLEPQKKKKNYLINGFGLAGQLWAWEGFSSFLDLAVVESSSEDFLLSLSVRRTRLEGNKRERARAPEEIHRSEKIHMHCVALSAGVFHTGTYTRRSKQGIIRERKMTFRPGGEKLKEKKYENKKYSKNVTVIYQDVWIYFLLWVESRIHVL